MTNAEADMQKNWGRVGCVRENSAAPATQPRPSACLLGTAQFRDGSQKEVSVGQESQAVHIWETEATAAGFCTH